MRSNFCICSYEKNGKFFVILQGEREKELLDIYNEFYVFVPDHCYNSFFNNFTQCWNNCKERFLTEESELKVYIIPNQICYTNGNAKSFMGHVKYPDILSKNTMIIFRSKNLSTLTFFERYINNNIWFSPGILFYKPTLSENKIALSKAFQSSKSEEIFINNLNLKIFRYSNDHKLLKLDKYYHPIGLYEYYEHDGKIMMNLVNVGDIKGYIRDNFLIIFLDILIENVGSFINNKIFSISLSIQPIKKLNSNDSNDSNDSFFILFIVGDKYERQDKDNELVLFFENEREMLRSFYSFFIKDDCDLFKISSPNYILIGNEINSHIIKIIERFLIYGLPILDDVILNESPTCGSKPTFLFHRIISYNSNETFNYKNWDFYYQTHLNNCLETSKRKLLLNIDFNKAYFKYDYQNGVDLTSSSTKFYKVGSNKIMLPLGIKVELEQRGYKIIQKFLKSSSLNNMIDFSIQNSISIYSINYDHMDIFTHYIERIFMKKNIFLVNQQLPKTIISKPQNESFEKDLSKLYSLKDSNSILNLFGLIKIPKIQHKENLWITKLGEGIFLYSFVNLFKRILDMFSLSYGTFLILNDQEQRNLQNIYPDYWNKFECFDSMGEFFGEYKYLYHVVPKVAKYVFGIDFTFSGLDKFDYKRFEKYLPIEGFRYHSPTLVNAINLIKYQCANFACNLDDLNEEAINKFMGEDEDQEEFVNEWLSKNFFHVNKPNSNIISINRNYILSRKSVNWKLFNKIMRRVAKKLHHENIPKNIELYPFEMKNETIFLLDNEIVKTSDEAEIEEINKTFKISRKF